MKKNAAPRYSQDNKCANVKLSTQLKEFHSLIIKVLQLAWKCGTVTARFKLVAILRVQILARVC